MRSSCRHRRCSRSCQPSGWARRWRSRLIFEVRDLWPLTLQELGGLSSRHPLVVVMRWFESRAYRVADAVVSVLPAAAGHLEAHGMAPGKLHVIPNGVSESAFAEPASVPPAEVREAVGAAAFTVGFVGTLGMANALEALIDAAGLLAGTDIRIVIVGQGPDEDRLRARAAGVANVVFAGAVAKSDVPATLRLFDVCYVGFHRSPLYRFGIAPNKVYDYMAAGRPIILAAQAANDVVRDAECGVTVAPDDPAALADAIRALHALPTAERARLGANGRAYVGARTRLPRARQALPAPCFREPTHDSRGSRPVPIADRRLAWDPGRPGDPLCPGSRRALRDPSSARRRSRRRSDPARLHLCRRSERDPVHGRPTDLCRYRSCLLHDRSDRRSRPRSAHATRVILAQNTFGLSADLDALETIAARRGVTVVDDCAHGMGGRYGGRPERLTGVALLLLDAVEQADLDWPWGSRHRQRRPHGRSPSSSRARRSRAEHRAGSGPSGARRRGRAGRPWSPLPGRPIGVPRVQSSRRRARILG